MLKIETIRAADAPPPPTKMPENSRQLLEALKNLKKDEVLRLQPDTGNTMRKLKTAVGRLATRNNIKGESESWTDENRELLYGRRRP